MKSKLHKHRNSGFTLIEIMVVVLILGLVISTVGPSVWNALFSSQSKVAGNQIRLFHSTLDQYKLEVYSFPESLDELTEPNPTTGQPFIKIIPLDPWKNEYDYEKDSEGNPFITCYGADGEPGGDNENQDITTETVFSQ
ncbi:MAG: type II secretion system major pseudopilin GspG [Planctomycetes bacterium]|nr:type II secretion system major pseudopilin GspG [Planctomycetota bacterium]MCP4772446.1 type II secretion system major pseudopilin GspG [Planctomycetota bacterium]MCP4860161.1 type II secretion system major pseudopilin GspG [Planctomycetota bacterium]